MDDIIIIVILIGLIGGAAAYMYRAKKRGQTCIGCPYAKKCGGHKCGCGKAYETKENEPEKNKRINGF